MNEYDYLLENLKEDVQKVYAGRLSTSTDFAKLSDRIYSKLGHTLSDSTLKRIWGYIGGTSQAHFSSLDILAEYVGFQSFDEYQASRRSSSEFFSSKKISASELNSGDKIIIGWFPDKKVILEYIGNASFIVVDGGSSRLKTGDRIENSHFILGQPLFLGSVFRDGKELPSYVAGKANGLTMLEIV